MLELVWQKTETILAILSVVGILVVALGSIVLAGIWVYDVLKPSTPSKVVRHRKFSTVTPIMHKRGHSPRRHKPGHRRSARMDYHELGENPCASILDSTCPGGRDDS